MVGVSGADVDSFRFWESYYDALRALPDDARRGEFVMALCAFVFDGIDEPEVSDPAVGFGLRLVAEQARRSMELTRSARAAGARGGRPRKGQERGA